MSEQLQELQTQLEILKTQMQLQALKGPAVEAAHPWEYKNIRFDFIGRGITQEFNILDVDGERKKGWWVGGMAIKTLPDMMNALGGEGWEMVSHVVNQDNQANLVTLHYMTFKRPGKVEVDSRYDGHVDSAKAKNLGNRVFNTDAIGLF